MKVSKWYEGYRKSKKEKLKEMIDNGIEPIRVTTIMCHECSNEYSDTKIYRFSWRYTSKVRTYKKTGRNMCVTGYHYLCGNCLEKKTLRKIT